MSVHAWTRFDCMYIKYYVLMLQSYVGAKHRFVFTFGLCLSFSLLFCNLLQMSFRLLLPAASCTIFRLRSSTDTNTRISLISFLFRWRAESNKKSGKLFCRGNWLVWRQLSTKTKEIWLCMATRLNRQKNTHSWKTMVVTMLACVRLRETRYEREELS